MNLVAYTPVIVQGLCVTLIAWLIATIISLCIGTLLGVIACNKLTTKMTFRLVFIYTFITKGVPAYVHILIAYFVIPGLLGVHIPAFVAAVAALALCSSGYVTEIIRAGINSVPQGQWDACFVLGYPLSATLRRIIMPQAFKNALPALSGELEQLLKSSSLLATIGITELTRTGMNIISRELNPVPVYLMIAALYLLFSALLQGLRAGIEKRGNVYGNR